MATKKAAALAALVVATLAAGAAWWLATERDAPPRADGSDATAAAPHGGRSRSPRADRARAADHPPPGLAPAAATAPNDRPVFLVVDAVTGEALAGASVWVVCADGSTRTAVALGDGGGLALEPSLVGRLATLWAAAPAHARRRLTDVTLDAAPRTLALDPAVAPRIEFVTETGRALGREELRLRFGGSIPSSALALVADDVFRGGDVARTLPLLFGPADAWRAAVSLADDGASMRLADGAASGRWRLFVERPGAAAWISAPFEAGADAVIAVPMPEVMATRRVRFVADDTGAPVADARIAAWHDLGRETPALRGAELRADGQGCVTLPYEPPETRGDGVRPRWQLDAPGRAAMIDAWREIDRAAAADPVETAVPRSATVEGEAYLPSGLPAAGLRVVTADTGFAWGATVGADGRFRIEGAPARDGSVHLILYAGSSMSQSRAQVGDDGVAHAVIGAKSEPVRARIEGRVTIGGAPLAGALICDQPVDRKGSFVRTDRDGRFALDGLDVAVEHDLVVYLGDPQAGDSRHRIRTRAPLRLEAARPVDVAFDLPSGTIRATVLDADTGAPVPGARVSARPAAPSPPGGRLPGFDHGAGWADFSGADGVVLLAALEPGAAHVVRAEADGYEPAERNDVVPGSAEHPAPLALRLSKLR